MPEQLVRNWGGFPSICANVTESRNQDDCCFPLEGPAIPRGAGRCYGDSSLQNRIFSTVGWNKIIGFDEGAGTVTCESGVTLGDLLGTIVPRGFFLPVTPGTKWITVGGAVAANVHGKNHHHAGAFGRWVDELTILTASGVRRTCSRENDADLFRNTIGGMGLTGVILTVTFRIVRITSDCMEERTLPARDLASLLDVMDASFDQPYLVAWLDLAGKSGALLRTARHASGPPPETRSGRRTLAARSHGQIRLPTSVLAPLMNRSTMQAYNMLYRWNALFRPHRLVHYNTFFYPLDRISHWSDLYGLRGMLQYQCVLPADAARAGYGEMLAALSQSGCTAYLAVMKRMGAPDPDCSPLSFPTDGYSLAMDFRNSPQVRRLLDTFDAIVIHHGGRVYLAKDARMSAATCARMYPPFPHPEEFCSLQSQRLCI